MDAMIDDKREPDADDRSEPANRERVGREADKATRRQQRSWVGLRRQDEGQPYT